MFNFTRLQLVFLVLSLIFTVNGLPIYPRQQVSGEPQTVKTTKSVETSAGTMEEVCTITLTPITDANGNPAVLKVSECSFTIGASNNGSEGGAPSASSEVPQSTSAQPESTSTAAESTSTMADSTSASAESTSVSVESTAASSESTAAPTDSSATEVTDTATATATATDATAVPGNGASGNGFTTIAVGDASSAAPSSTSVSEAPAATGNGGASGNGFTTIAVGDASAGTSTAAASTQTPSTTTDGATETAGGEAANASASASASASAGGSGTAEAAESSQSQSAAFTLPGKQLSVLPIGLGVFAGISVIALIVVGLVTYERTKYRKAFRQRKLAEQGTTMGYGGMAQR